MKTSGRRKVNGTSPEELLVRKLFQQLSKRTKLRFRPTEYDKDFVFTRALSYLSEESRLRLLLICARRGYITIAEDIYCNFEKLLQEHRLTVIADRYHEKAAEK